ncbi:MAG: hypothetical protein H7293_09050, partial [Candidatus Saccharibacteria bacterium]|nr:hypothetical protein [Rhodoferax sp.]
MRAPHALPFDWFSEHEVSSFHRAECPAGENEAQRIDDATWRDLDAPTYLRRIGSTVGIYGRQMLYQRLRMGQDTAAFAASLQHEPTELPAAIEPIRQRLRALDVDITPTLFHGGQVEVPRWTRLIPWAPVVALLAVLLPFLHFLPTLHLGILSPWLIALYLVFNGWTRMKLHGSLTRWMRQRDGVVDMLKAAQALGHLARAQQPVHPVLNALQQQLDDVQHLLAQLSPTWVERTPMLAEYANLFALHAYAELGERSIRLISHLPAL